MNISQLLQDIQPTDFDLEIKGLCLNTQNAQPGDVFIALQGESTHGINYIDQAINKGCVAVLIDSQEGEYDIPSIRIDNLSKHLKTLASSMYPNAQKVEVIGITGTNGKTSVACFVSQLLEALGTKNGLIGTLGITHSNAKSNNTTPDILSLYRTLDNYHNQQIKTAVIEVSSHALAQHRTQGLNIIQAVLTNFSQDHLDYHHTLEAYRSEKLKLFELDSVQSVIVNTDDDNHSHFLKAAHNKQQVLYSINDFTDIKINKQGFLAQLNNYVFEVPLLGEFNLLNMLAAYSSVKSLGFSEEQIIPLLHKLKAPPGRMQKVNNHLAWVDYAHTPDALKKAIVTLQNHYPEFNVRVVFGCGGNRDQDKRAKMGKIASSLASTIILTDDNPREEDPRSIIDDILNGIDDSYEVDIIQDRQLAIETAITTLKEDECLLIAGKGHESTQQYKDKTIAMNDIAIANNA